MDFQSYFNTESVSLDILNSRSDDLNCNNLLDDCSPIGEPLIGKQLTYLTSQQIADKVGDMYDLRVTHIQELLNYVSSDIGVQQDVNWKDLRKKLMKKKNQLKRLYAKNRGYSGGKRQYYVIEAESEEKQITPSERKKKRNRALAQKSRDQRKVKMQELQTSNTTLKQQTEKMRLENEQLKKQLQDFNSHENWQPPKSKLFSMLLIMGIMFIVSFIKDTFQPNERIKFMGDLENPKDILSSERQRDLISLGQKLFVQMEQTSDFKFVDNQDIRGIVTAKLEQIKSDLHDLQLPTGLNEQIKALRDKCL